MRFYLAKALVLVGRSAKALPSLAEANRLNPDWPAALNAEAWILATHTDGEVGDSRKALRLAERASELSGRRNAGTLDTLAAAYVANSDFDKAAKTTREALELAASENADLADQLRQRLRLYESGTPFVE